nr:A24 family peptidase [Stakelama sediminis]
MVSASTLGVLGAIFGSFLATLCLRWPRGKSVLKGRSQCDGCGRFLTGIDLIPLFSAVFSRGRCGRCGALIAPLHWKVELTAALAGIIAALCFPFAQAAALAVLVWLALPLIVLDWRHLWLPDPLTFLLALAGLVLGGLLGISFDAQLIGGLTGFGMLWSMAAGYRLLRGRDGMGAGDTKLLGALGLWAGWQALPFILLLAALGGLGIALLYRTQERLDERQLPFGACLASAAITVAAANLQYGWW